jgi:glycosyltransferase involved in cell wall biosynthesis
MRRYRIDFALTVLTGNLTRYLSLRPVVDADPEVLARWFPLRTWVTDDWLRIFPAALRVRLRHVLDTWRIYLLRPPQAMVLHAFEFYYLYTCLQLALRRKTILINHCDGSIAVSHNPIGQALLRRTVPRTDLFLPWSEYAAKQMVTDRPDLPRDRLFILNPGIDLTRCPLRPPPPPASRFRLLFVGGDLMRKGADTLLDAFASGLHETCELDVATQSGYLSDEFKQRLLSTPNVRLHLDLTAVSPELLALYRQADAFVLPTNADWSPWVALEALAFGVPTIICPVAGIPEIVIHEQTGLLIPPKDPQAIVAAVERLRADPALCERLVQNGRAHVEEHYDALKNSQILLRIVKTLINGGGTDALERFVARSRWSKGVPSAAEPAPALIEEA